MTPVTIGLLAISMSVDAFIAALGRGAISENRGLVNALKTGVVFGAVEAVTPLIGWSLGVAASQVIQLWDHWVAFVLLAGVGLRMVLNALRRSADDRPATGSPLALLVTAIGTSIDAMAVGVSLAFLDANILMIAATIGFTTFAMSATGTLAGGALGERFGRVIEVLGGLGLIGLGSMILVEHLTA